MSNEPAVQIENVSKKYRLFSTKGHRLREALNPFRRTYHREFWALKDITLKIPKGHTVGILGMNGSGKSTLLQIISSVLQPTSGTVQVNGKVAALLELGAGFNPEMTGRDNVILNGTIMGLKREQIMGRMEEIEAFADIGEFFDQPMKTYSSGMYMRVAFSTALYVDPEILILDEVLSVGDAKFQEKCFRRFKGFQEAGKTILLVTHDRSALPRYCDLGILLHQGKLVATDDPARIADLYGEILAFGRLRQQDDVPVAVQAEAVPAVEEAAPRTIDEAAPAALEQDVIPAAPAEQAGRGGTPAEDRCPQNPTYNKYEHRYGNGRAEIIDYAIVSRGVVNPTSLASGTSVDIQFTVLFREDIQAPIVGIIFKNKEGVIAYGVNTEWMKLRLRPANGGDMRSYRFTVQANLSAGDWFIDLAVAESTTELCDNRSALAHLYLMDRGGYVGLARLDARFAEVEPAA